MSEASYVNIFSGHKLINNAKNGSFWRVFENPKFAVKECYQQADQCMQVGVFRLFVLFNPHQNHCYPPCREAKRILAN